MSLSFNPEPGEIIVIEDEEIKFTPPEITDEMIEAGLHELYGYDITEPRRDEMREAVSAVFVAMLQAATQSPAKP